MTSTGTPGLAGRARPLRLAVLAAVLLAVAVAAVVVGAARSDDAPSGPTGRTAVERVLADEPGAPVALPVDVPGGYALVGGDTASGPEGGVPVAAWVFRPVQQESGLAVVQVCVAPPARCTASQDGVLDRQVDGREVSVIALGTEQGRARTLEVWGDVQLTGDWRSLAWIDEPLPDTGGPPVVRD